MKPAPFTTDAALNSQCNIGDTCYLLLDLEVGFPVHSLKSLAEARVFEQGSVFLSFQHSHLIILPKINVPPLYATASQNVKIILVVRDRYLVCIVRFRCFIVKFRKYQPITIRRWNVKTSKKHSNLSKMIDRQVNIQRDTFLVGDNIYNCDLTPKENNQVPHTHPKILSLNKCNART